MKRVRVVISDSEKCVGCQCCMFACARLKGTGLSKARIGVRSVGGMERGFVIILCRACEDPPCLKVCPTGALEPRKGGGVRLREDRCIGCGYCQKACPIGCVFWDEEANKPMICVHCGYCIRYCPHGVLKMEGRQDAERFTT